jgi:spermidine synthase
LESLLSEYSNVVEVYIDRGQYMLCSSNAMYSYGLKYAPFKKAFKLLHDKKSLPSAGDFLLLGGGFCSAVIILNKKYSTQLNSTVIEKDSVIIQLAKKYLAPKINNKLQFLNVDAFTYIKSTTKKYSLIGIDLFIEMKMPKQVQDFGFLESCKILLAPNGVLIFNSHFQTSQEALDFQKIFTTIFKIHYSIVHQKNIIYIGQI